MTYPEFLLLSIAVIGYGMFVTQRKPRCPSCGSLMRKVPGWKKEECTWCGLTRDI